MLSDQRLRMSLVSTSHVHEVVGAIERRGDVFQRTVAVEGRQLVALGVHDDGIAVDDTAQAVGPQRVVACALHEVVGG